MVLEYGMVFQVLESWERLRRIPDYEKVAGTILFQRLFQKCPATKLLFGFPINMDPNQQQMLKSIRFLVHASHMIEMLDKALNLLGPDDELLDEILSDLGKKHAKYGIKADYFPVMGEALHEMLEEVLQDDYTAADAQAWKDVYHFLCTKMCKAMNKEKAVLESWAKLKSIDNYKEIAGSILFQSLFQKCPEAKELFGFPIDMDVKSEIMLQSKRFKMHSEYFIEMLDSALNMIEKEELKKNIGNLGRIHSRFGVKEEYFPLMGEALIHTLRKTLRTDFNAELEQAWTEVYNMLSAQIIKAMNAN